MAKYIKNFVTGHGITFEKSKRNIEAFEKAFKLWEDIFSRLELDGNSIVMLCGAKNNGKSSLSRYLVNQYLRPNSRLEQVPVEGSNDRDIQSIDGDGALEQLDDPERYVYYVDYDPGQCELTSPGIVSAHIIRASAPPLQSPTYLNVNQHDPIVHSSIGGINMSVNPKCYIENCRFVYNCVVQHRKKQTVKQPIFINTMGHIRNVGLAMLMDLIKICKPTNLIVLNVSSDPMRTIYADLNPQAVDNARASFFYETSQQAGRSALNYKCDIIDLQFSFVDSSSIAGKNRTALQLAQLASIPEALYKPIMQLSYKFLSLQSIYIYCESSYPLKEAIVLELIYHSWVHLVKLKKPVQQVNVEATREPNDQSENDVTAQHESVCKIIDNLGENVLYGCGIVAEIDIEKRRVGVITPLSQEVLERDVDCIVKPLSIQVPREILQEDMTR